jgi:hypothetical protein
MTRADPACREQEHRASDWALERDRSWSCGVCQPPSSGLVKGGLVVHRNAVVPDQRDELTPAESGRLAELEAVVDRGLKTFIEVGRALAEIRDSRLYRQAHSTFEAYCRERWGFGRTRAHRLIEAADVVAMLPMGNKPANERQARELAPLKDDETAMFDVWRELRAEHGDNLTAGRVKRVVGARLRRDQRQAEEKARQEEVTRRWEERQAFARKARAEPEARLANIDDDLAERVRDGGATLDYAESVMVERDERMDKWVQDILDALTTLGRMAGYPVPPGVAERLSVEERAHLNVVLEVLAEAFGYGPSERQERGAS